MPGIYPQKSPPSRTEDSVFFLVPRKGRLIALSDRVLKAAHDCPRLSAWVAGKMASEKMVHRRSAEGTCLAGNATSETRSPAGWRNGQLVAGCRQAPLVRARNDMLRARPARVRASFEGAGIGWWTLPLDSLVVRASQEFCPFSRALT